MRSLILYLTPGLRPGLRAQSLLRSSHYTGNASDIRLCRSFQRYLGHYPLARFALASPQLSSSPPHARSRELLTTALLRREAFDSCAFRFDNRYGFSFDV